VVVVIGFLWDKFKCTYTLFAIANYFWWNCRNLISSSCILPKCLDRLLTLLIITLSVWCQICFGLTWLLHLQPNNLHVSTKAEKKENKYMHPACVFWEKKSEGSTNTFATRNILPSYQDQALYSKKSCSLSHEDKNSPFFLRSKEVSLKKYNYLCLAINGYVVYH